MDEKMNEKVVSITDNICKDLFDSFNLDEQNAVIKSIRNRIIENRQGRIEGFAKESEALKNSIESL